MKKKKTKKLSPENPNQLNFEFIYKEHSIDVHIPKSEAAVLNTNFVTSKGLAIRLAEG